MHLSGCECECELRGSQPLTPALSNYLLQSRAWPPGKVICREHLFLTVCVSKCVFGECAHTQTNTHTHACHTHTRTQRTHTNTHTHTHTRTHTYTHKHTHRHTHTHTLT